jgi:hypothetical protein
MEMIPLVGQENAGRPKYSNPALLGEAAVFATIGVHREMPGRGLNDGTVRR